MLRVFAWCILSLSLFYSCTAGEAGTKRNFFFPPGSDYIRLNQVGFYPNGPKRAVVIDSLGDSFQLLSIEQNEVVYSGSLTEALYWEFSGEKLRIADFSDFSQTGTYALQVGNHTSHTFRIAQDIHLDAHKASLKSYYFQRASMDLAEKEAGPWARDRGHEDLEVYIHETVASDARPLGTIIQAPKGWYDAGDYGKYTANAAYATWIMLHYYEQFPQELRTLSYDLPESDNQIPDILDEALWSIRYLLAMQEPESGLVYHKLTGLAHSRKVMPKEDIDKRYVIGKSTGTNYAFAALMAQAARVFAGFKQELPGLADSCLQASGKAWDWAEANPGIFYQNPPDVHTGQYKDDYHEDEQAWAATELFLSTGEKRYDLHLSKVQKDWQKAPGWNAPGILAWMSLNLHRDKVGDEGFSKNISKRFLSFADALVAESRKNPYHMPLGRDKYDFIWGSNGIGASSGMCLVHAYLISADESYLEAAVDMQDYLLGRNATNYSFLTGFGSIRPLDIHHRPSASDEVLEPIPGLLVGGPQGEKNYEGCQYPSSYPAAFYLDSWCSYSTNEVCLNWNAPLVYLSGGLEILFKQKK